MAISNNALLDDAKPTPKGLLFPSQIVQLGKTNGKVFLNSW